MSQPYDSATTLLTTLSAAVRQFYHEGFWRQSERFGASDRGLFTPSARTVEGDGITVQTKSALLYNTQIQTDLYAELNSPTAFSAGSYKATMSETPSSNDYARIDTCVRLGWYDKVRKASTDVSAVTDLATELSNEMLDDWQEAVTVYRRIPRSGKIGEVSGAPKQNDAAIFADCTATPGASTGARFVLDKGIIAYFQPNRRFKVYSSAGVYRSTLIVSDVNPADNSVGVYIWDTTTKSTDTTTAVGAGYITNGDYLYVSTINMNGKFLAEWFTVPSSGDSFFGKDRTSPANRWLRPTRVVPSGSSSSTLVNFTKTHLDNVGVTLLGVTPNVKSNKYVVDCQPTILQKFINEVGQQNVNLYPTTDVTGQLVAQYGFDGDPIYRSPTLGTLVLRATPLASPNTVRGLRIGDWESSAFSSSGIEILPGDGGMGWYREQAPTPGNGKGLSWRMDGIGTSCDLCLFPRVQWEIPFVK